MVFNFIRVIQNYCCMNHSAYLQYYMLHSRSSHGFLPLFVPCLEISNVNPNESWWSDSNRQPIDYRSIALPIEPHQQIIGFTCLSYIAISFKHIMLTDRPCLLYLDRVAWYYGSPKVVFPMFSNVWIIHEAFHFSRMNSTSSVSSCSWPAIFSQDFLHYKFIRLIRRFINANVYSLTK